MFTRFSRKTPKEAADEKRSLSVLFVAPRLPSFSTATMSAIGSHSSAVTVTRLCFNFLLVLPIRSSPRAGRAKSLLA
jgi:hypothetical protein